MDFVAIDFETACGNANSACQLAIVTVRSAKIEDERCWLIRPPRMYFSARNIAVHGIRPRQVVEAPTMEQVWDELQSLLDGQVILAHNARFDIGVLIHSLAAYGIACPQLEFSCTRALGRNAWPGRPKYGLKPLGEWLGIDFQHHDALEDARCCAKIALAVARDCEGSTLIELEKKLRLTRGVYRHGQITGPRTIGRRTRESSAGGAASTDRWGFPNASSALSAANIDAAAIVASAANSQPLFGKNIVLLGALRGLDLAGSHALIEKLGGNCHANITPDTHYVVACGTSLESANQTICRTLADAGPTDSEPSASGIRLISERQFRALIPGGKANAWR